MTKKTLPTTLPVEITLTHIKGLRMRGKHEEAIKILNTWRENNKRLKKIEEKELLFKDRKIARRIGLCYKCFLRKAEKTKTRCLECLEREKKNKLIEKEIKING